LPIPGVNSELLLTYIPSTNKQVISKEAFVKHVQAEKPELLVTMGAGDIDLILSDLKLALTHH
jgi:UDP-N-acetylmuramate--alanine ligase